MKSMTILRKPFRYTYNNAAFILIGINVLCFFYKTIAPRQALTLFAMIPVRVALEGYVWQLFTYMFFHSDIYHLLFNMLGLFFFGTQIEQRMGSREFLLFYLLSGFIAGLFSFAMYWFSGAYMVFLLGASGAIYAVLLAFAVYFPHAQIYVMGIIPVRAPILVLLYAGIELFSQVFNVRGGIAHLTHLAGFGAAFLYFVIRLGINPLSVFLDRRRF
jgi:membrane associated rhomboid family serine protease